MYKSEKISWRVFISRLSVSSALAIFLTSFIIPTMASLYADEMPFGDSMTTAVLQGNVPREVYGKGTRVVTSRLSVPFTVDIIDPGNDSDTATLGDEDGDDRSTGNPFVNGFDLRNGSANFAALDRIEVYINLAKTDDNGLTPTQAGGTIPDPCYGGAFTQNAWAFNPDPTVTTDYFGWDRTGSCAYSASTAENIIDGDTNPCSDANTDRSEPDEGAAPGACGGIGANPTSEFYLVEIEQPIGTVKIRARITGRTGLFDTGQEAIGEVGGLLSTDLSLEDDGAGANEPNTFDYDTNLKNTVHLTIRNANDAGKANFNPEGSFLIRITANSVIDGPGEDSEQRQIPTTTSTTTTTTATTTTTTTISTTTTTESTTTTETTTTTEPTTTTETTTTTSTTTTTIPTCVCPRTQGFWKNHPDDWPVDSLILGCETYTKEELLAILDLSVTGDASISLAHQLIAALLNIANGTDPTPVNSAITDAHNLLCPFSPDKLPYEVDPSSSTGQSMDSVKDVLDSYNNREFLPEECQCEEEETTTTTTETTTSTESTTTVTETTTSTEPTTTTSTTTTTVISISTTTTTSTTTTIPAELPTRTIGFWKVRPDLTESVLSFIKVNSNCGFPLTLGDANTIGNPPSTLRAKTICENSELLAAFWSSISKKSNKDSRSSIDKARMQLTRQLVAAILNQAFFGSIPPIDDETSVDIITAGNMALAGDDITEMLRVKDLLDDWNNSGDDVPYSGWTGTAQPKAARKIAKPSLPFFDVWFDNSVGVCPPCP